MVQKWKLGWTSWFRNFGYENSILFIMDFPNYVIYNFFKRGIVAKFFWNCEKWRHVTTNHKHIIPLRKFSSDLQIYNIGFNITKHHTSWTSVEHYSSLCQSAGSIAFCSINNLKWHEIHNKLHRPILPDSTRGFYIGQKSTLHCSSNAPPPPTWVFCLITRCCILQVVR